MKSIIVIFFGLLTISGFAQSSITKTTPFLNDFMYSSTDTEELLVWVFFTDKGEDISHYLANPQAVVSDKSLRRRSKVLPEDKLISKMDVPVNEEYVEELVNRDHSSISPCLTASTISAVPA